MGLGFKYVANYYSSFFWCITLTSCFFCKLYSRNFTWAFEVRKMCRNVETRMIPQQSIRRSSRKSPWILGKDDWVVVSNIVSFHPILGEMIQFDECFSDGLKPPTRWRYCVHGTLVKFCRIFDAKNWSFGRCLAGFSINGTKKNQVPQMEVRKYLIWLSLRVGKLPYVSCIHRAYIGTWFFSLTMPSNNKINQMDHGGPQKPIVINGVK